MTTTENLIKLSIITINYNNAGGLQKTIESVVNQTFKNFEYIIIDGCSTDDSVEIIKKFESRINYWVSEKDNGIYNAQNKGAKVAKGEYLLFLNGGDYFYNASVLEKVIPFLYSSDIVYGDLKTDESDNPITFPDVLSFDFLHKNYLPHPSAFIRKELLFDLGMYREDFKICSDWAIFIIAICKYGTTYKHVPYTISVFDKTGLSSTEKGIEIIKAEKQEIINEYFAAYKEDYKLLDNFKLLFNSRLFKLLKSAGFFKYIKSAVV